MRLPTHSDWLQRMPDRCALCGCFRHYRGHNTNFVWCINGFDEAGPPSRWYGFYILNQQLAQTWVRCGAPPIPNRTLPELGNTGWGFPWWKME